MEKITIYNNQTDAVKGNEFNPKLFNDFVSWIDRSEKTTRSYLINLKQFVTWLKYAGIKNPLREDILSYRNWLNSEHDAITMDPEAPHGWKYRTDGAGNPIRIECKPNTVAAYLRIVCMFFKWTESENLYPDIAKNIHAPKVNNETHKKEALTAAAVLQIESSIAAKAETRQLEAAEAEKDTAGRMQRCTEQGKRLYAMYLLAVNAGLRTVEISRAKIKDLETKNEQTWLYIWGKGHSEADYRKPLAPEVAEAINDYLKSRTDKPTSASPLFVSTGNRSGGKAIATTTISTMLKKAMQEAGYNSERITAHSLRHTAGTTVQELTKDLYTTQKYMRHNNPKTTEIYIHSDTEKQEVGIVQQLYNHYHGKEAATDKEKLQDLVSRMSPKQLEKLAGIAEAMI